MSHTDLVQRLIARSTELSAVTHAPVLVDDPDANALVTDLAGRPHAFVYACIADRQVKAGGGSRVDLSLERADMVCDGSQI